MRAFIITVLFLSFFTGTAFSFLSGHALPVAHATTPPATNADSTSGEITEEDPLGRETPQGTVKGFLKAIAAEYYEEAALYLDLNALPHDQRAKAAQIAHEFKILLDHQGRLQPDKRIKDHPAGNIEDGLDKDLDTVGVLRDKNRTIKINLQRVTQDSGPPLWLFEASLVADIPHLARDLDPALIEKLLIGDFLKTRYHGAALGQWLTMAGFYILVYMGSGILVRSIIRIVHRLPWVKQSKAPSEHHMIEAFEIPLRLFATIWISTALSFLFSISLIVRHSFEPFSMAILWIAAGLFLWNLIDILTTWLEQKMPAHERYNMRSIIVFGRRTAKLFFIVLVVILILDAFGVDITTALAALGIGGIALALGAQKTLENFIGSLSIIIDRPLRIGDRCKIGDTIGVVEDIGMRSTRIRTLDKTLVTIPNGELSTQRIENYAERSSFLINRMIVLRYDSTSAQIRMFISKSLKALQTHEKIDQTANMVRFPGFSEHGYTVQIWCYILTSNADEFFAMQATVTYALIDAAEESGVYFAIPAQTFLPAINQTGGIQN